MKKISIVVPCYNEEAAIPIYYQEMKKVLSDMQVSWELIFVDDGSSDQTIKILRKLAAKDSACRYLSFSRNFGKEAALYAGLSNSKGEYTAVMDVDLQDPPELLPQMYDILQNEDYDCVAARRTTRKGEPKIRSFLSNQFYRVMNKLTKTHLVSGARDFRLMKRSMLNAILKMKEYNRFSKGMFEWVGFHTKWLDYEHKERCAGETKWPFKKLVAYSIEGITGFTVAPLTLSAFVGVLFFGISIVMIVVIMARTLIFGDPVAGWPSMACIIFMVSGIQLFCLGIAGEYLSKMYLETKQRPIYIVRESSEGKKNEKANEKAS
ncbi:MAG: glycosyltransferase family 2 protein [Clostridiales bacterium]|nr:glycosyltransferase family 2 protein [Clostridiales bacterium]